MTDTVLTQQTRRLPGRRPTLDDVARGSGVSKSTVSRVINGEDKVRAEVVERVREVIAELGYVPNSAARQLVTRRNNAIAVVAGQPQNRLFIDPFFDLHLRGIRKELVAHGAQPVLLFLEEPEEYPRVGDFLGGGHVDGALLFSLRADDSLPGMIDRLGLPAVFGGRPLVRDGEPAHDRVYVDAGNRGGSREAVRHLVAQAGNASPRSHDHRPRRPGGLGARPPGRLPGRPAGRLAPPDRTLRPHPAGRGRRHDIALQVLRERGRRVPDGVAVVGFDDLAPIAHTDPPLTTVHQDIEGMGRLMARLLFSHGDDGPTDGGATAPGPRSSVVTPTRLVVRQSA